MTPSHFCTYQETANLFKSYDIPLPAAEMVKTPKAAAIAAENVGYPVALKIISTQETHKSDKGLVALNLTRKSDLIKKADSLLNRTANLQIEGLLVQKMAPSGIEVLAGLINDPHFGVMLALGAGGLLVELLDQVTLRKVPISQAEARYLLKIHPLHKFLNGYRGNPPGDIKSLAKLLENLSTLGEGIKSNLDSLDINPVIVSPQGVHVVDFRLKLKGTDK